jgi:hypothetical protein
MVLASATRVLDRIVTPLGLVVLEETVSVPVLLTILVSASMERLIAPVSRRVRRKAIAIPARCVRFRHAVITRYVSEPLIAAVALPVRVSCLEEAVPMVAR